MEELSGHSFIERGRIAVKVMCLVHGKSTRSYTVRD
jgi:hypothetical protein